jgi:membrane protease subunit HflK
VPDTFSVADLGGRIHSGIKGNPRGVPWLALGLLLVALVIWTLSTTFYTVDTQENALIFRFGRHRAATGTVGPGLHTKLPFGIDKVYKARVKEVKKEEFGYRTIRPGIDTQYEVEASLMLTGDLNMTNVRWVVRYKIDDLKAYIVNLRDVRAAVRDVSDAVMRRVVGDYSVDEVLTIGRQEIQFAAQQQMQALLKDYEAGIEIVAVRLQETTPPEQVRDAFNEVNRARQEKQTLILEAKRQRDKEIPAARGQQKRVILEAEGYKIEKVNNAKGEVAEFEAVLERYEQAREITRQRLYIETMSRVLPKAGRKYVIQGGQDVLKLLPIEQLPVREGGAR